MLTLGISLIFVILFVDFLYFGFLPQKLNIWPGIDRFKYEKILLEDCDVAAKTDVKGKYVDGYINARKGYRSIVVTDKNIVFKNTNNTFLLNIPIDSLVDFTIEKKLMSKKIKIHDDEGNVTTLYPSNLDKWIEVMQMLGIAQRDCPEG